ncbi:uncharacterized protein LOC110457768 [Mizuhopecten yessoensis]|uniref:uncharacterized protein LOC110457768 n=1 Tax=Mizuhopecten yessoensis TaxID=6573 RepID=UPI000B4588FD|nr:uncharacterized protein LOC110457768 [Mizuhopecten yessoensis]
MERLGIQFSLVLMLIFCQVSRSQFPFYEKYRNPGIQWYSRQLCRNPRCGFEELCEFQTLPCLIPTCVSIPVPVCTPVGAGRVDKGGRCPPPSFIISDRIRCFQDFGCPGNELCCHGYRGSKCSPFFPLQN